MTLQLELGGVEDPDIRRAFENVAQQFPLHALNMANDVLLLSVTGTKRQIAFGTGSVVFTAANLSATSNVTHGMSVTPSAVFLQEQSGFVRYVPSAIGATTFTVQGYVTTGAVTTGTLGFWWTAVG